MTSYTFFICRETDPYNVYEYEYKCDRGYWLNAVLKNFLEEQYLFLQYEMGDLYRGQQWRISWAASTEKDYAEWGRFSIKYVHYYILSWRKQPHTDIGLEMS